MHPPATIKCRGEEKTMCNLQTSKIGSSLINHATSYNHAIILNVIKFVTDIV